VFIESHSSQWIHPHSTYLTRRTRVFPLCHVPFSVGIDSLLVQPFRVIYCVVILHCTRSLAWRDHLGHKKVASGRAASEGRTRASSAQHGQSHYFFWKPAKFMPRGVRVPACPRFPGFCVAPGCLPAPRVLGSLARWYPGNWVPSRGGGGTGDLRRPHFQEQEKPGALW
jgi:hypothetical protein